MKTIIFSSFIYMTFVYATCNKRVDCKQNIYSFEAFYKAYPISDSIKINDTIYFELVIPSKLKDVLTNQIVDYSGAENLGPSIQYGEFIGGDILNPGGIPAANFFENDLIWGTSVSSDMPNQVRGFRCAEEDGNYKLKVGIVPKKRGIFSISLGNLAGVYRKKSKCDKASFNLTFKDTDQHLYLYEQNRPGYTPSEYEETHMYCFKVY